MAVDLKIVFRRGRFFGCNLFIVSIKMFINITENGLDCSEYSKLRSLCGFFGIRTPFVTVQAKRTTAAETFLTAYSKFKTAAPQKIKKLKVRTN